MMTYHDDIWFWLHMSVMTYHDMSSWYVIMICHHGRPETPQWHAMTYVMTYYDDISWWHPPQWHIWWHIVAIRHHGDTRQWHIKKRYKTGQVYVIVICHHSICHRDMSSVHVIAIHHCDMSLLYVIAYVIANCVGFTGVEKCAKHMSSHMSLRYIIAICHCDMSLHMSLHMS